MSDHCHVWLMVSESNWGAKPFRFNNCWLELKDFKSFVETCWHFFQVQGWKCHVLKEKLKMLKERLRWWNKEVFGVIDLKIDKTVEEIHLLDNIVAEGAQIDVDGRKYLSVKFWNQIHAKESLLAQKLRSKWVFEGDPNTKLSHSCIEAKRRRNQLVALKVGEEWVEDVDGMKAEVKSHFQHLFSEPDFSRPSLDVFLPQKSLSWIMLT